MRKIIFALLTIAAMTACKTESKKALILYYSQTGTTKAVAEELRNQTGADICAFDITDPYTGTFDETIQRCMAERQTNYVPELATLGCDLSKYDVIYLGYPIWFGTYAPPVTALLKSASFEGKTIIPFCTFGSGGLEPSIADLKAALPSSRIMEGYGVRTARLYAVQKELNRFLIENGWKEGEIEALPEYSAETEVGEAEAAIFDQACSNYQYPLGTPVKVCSRKTADSVDYLFTAQSATPDGGLSESKVFVTVLEGRAPEFTRVAR